MSTPKQVVNTSGIAKIAGVKPKTVYMWRHRKKLPPEYDYIKNRPVWLLDDIVQWLKETNRSVRPDLELIEME